MNFDRVKGWRLFGIGMAMIVIGAAGLKTVDASEIAPLSAEELRQIEGRFSRLVVLSALAGSVVIQGGQVAWSAIQSGWKAASTGGDRRAAQERRACRVPVALRRGEWLSG